MCNDCEVCQKLFSSSQEIRRAENNLKPCICQNKDCPFCLAVEFYWGNWK